MTGHSADAPTLPRRQLLRLFGVTTGAVALGSCGFGSSGAPSDLAFKTGDFSGARLSAILRRSFIDEANELMTAQVRDWSRASNAVLEPRLLDEWREAYTAVSERRAVVGFQPRPMAPLLMGSGERFPGSTPPTP